MYGQDFFFNTWKLLCGKQLDEFIINKKVQIVSTLIDLIEFVYIFSCNIL